MPIPIVDNFEVNKSAPIDTRMTVADISARNSLSYKYDGLKVFCLSDRFTYIWNSTSSTWEADTSGTIAGSGSTDFIPKWISESMIGSSMIYTDETSITNGYSVGKVGINATSSNLKETFQVNANSGGSMAPPMVIHKGASYSILAENWYYDSGDQAFDITKGSSQIQYDNGSINFNTRAANSLASNISNRLRITTNDVLVNGNNLLLSTNDLTSPSSGFVLGSIMANSKFYGSTLSSIKFISATAFSGGVYSTDIVFYTKSSSSEYRSMTLKHDGSLIIGSNSTHSTDKLLVQGSSRLQGTANIESGIKFPSIQNAISDANTLDDYVEGSFVATIQPDSGTIVLDGSYNTLEYVKIGRNVHISGELIVSYVSSSSGFAKITMPFTSSSKSPASFYYSGLTSSFVGNTIMGYINGSEIYLERNLLSTGVITNDLSDFIIGGTVIVISLNYNTTN